MAPRRPTRLLGRLHPSARRAGACPDLYDLRWGSRDIRLIVLNDLPEHSRNAAWELFASDLARIRYGLTHDRPRRAERGSGSAISIE